MYLFIQKFVGVLLPTILICFVLNMLSGMLFSPPVPQPPAYQIEVAEAEGEDDKEDQTDKEAAPDVLAMIGTVDAETGKKAAKKCAACHTFDKDGANRVGPNLWGVVNRQVAAVEGFKYSTSMKEFAADKTWSYEALDEFLSAPKSVVAKTSMVFAGVKKPADRAALIAYLRSLADSPAPLPAAAVEQPAEPAADKPDAEAEKPAAAEDKPADAPKTEAAPASD